MRVVRRGHLFAGLFMLPWVVLYAVTAFLFNHPDAFPDHQTRTFGPTEVAGTALEGLPKPADAAARVVEALNGDPHAREGGRLSCRLVRPELAAYSGEAPLAIAQGRDQRHAVQLDVASNTGTVRSRPVNQASEQAPFAAESGVRIDRPLPERFTASIPAVLERLELPPGEVTLEEMPDLVFAVEAGGRLWHVTYDMQRGSVTGVPLDSSAESLSTRRLLTRLHLAHGYPAETNSRWFWAVVVDAMFAVMLFWSMSGILMWWQIKAVRWPGAAVLALSVLIATVLVIGMHRALAP
jgi:hypothetical protein